MGRKVGIIESTLRDGQQSCWATRMTTAMLLPALSALDRAGFHAIEVYGQAVMDASVRYLKENPWDRFRLIRERVVQTPLMMINGGLGFSVGRGAMPDDMLALYYKACAACGVDMFFVLDGMNDLRNLDIPIKAAKEAGKLFYGSIVYSISPVHTDAHFIEKTRQLAQKGVDALVLKDPNGVLTPERVRSLVPAMCQAAAPVPVYCHSHCVTGLGPATNLEAVKYGVDALWTCTRSLANGSSLPATDAMARHLERAGYDVGLDPLAVAEVEAHFRAMAEHHDKPVGVPAEYDPAYYVHQMPGGMISNFRAHLAQLGIQDRLDEVLEECPRVREDVGWVQMVTPFSQIIGTQAHSRQYQGRGWGSMMLQACLDDAKKAGMSGVAVMARDGPWLAGRSLFLANGFETADTAPPDYQLLVRKFGSDAVNPAFKKGWDRRLRKYSRGLTIVCSSQCPYVAKFTAEIAETAEKEYHITPALVNLKSWRDAQAAPTPYATFSVIYSGRLLADHQISRTRFRNIMNEIYR